MPSIRASHKAYERGQAARMQGKPFSGNPYKDPSCSIAWSLGWKEFRGTLKEHPAMRKRLLARLKMVR